jgi:hypothetical protein
MRILVSCPEFFDYEKFITEELKAYGDVTFINDRIGLNFFESALLRLGLFRERIYKKVYGSIRVKLAEEVFDLYLAINVEGFGPTTVDYLASKSKRRILYMWDSFSNKPEALNLISYFDKVLTFDPVDADARGLLYLPLYYPSCYHSEGRRHTNREAHSIILIGSLHSNRTKIAAMMNHNFVGFSAVLYVRNVYLFIYRWLVGEFSWSSYKFVSFTSLSHGEISRIYSRSDIVVDFAHPGQSGLTNRSFEALASGCGLITSNENIKDFEFFDERKIFFVDDWDNQVKMKDWVEKTYDASYDLEMKNYRIDNWIKRLLQ